MGLVPNPQLMGFTTKAAKFASFLNLPHIQRAVSGY